MLADERLAVWKISKISGLAFSGFKKKNTGSGLAISGLVKKLVMLASACMTCTVRPVMLT
jgi:hypothetical protein